MTSTYAEEARALNSGVNVVVNILVDNQSLENDGFAFGRCIGDLQREGWYLQSFQREDDGVHAILSRLWEVRGARQEHRGGMYATESPTA